MLAANTNKAIINYLILIVVAFVKYWGLEDGWEDKLCGVKFANGWTNPGHCQHSRPVDQQDKGLLAEVHV